MARFVRRTALYMGNDGGRTCRLHRDFTTSLYVCELLKRRPPVMRWQIFSTDAGKGMTWQVRKPMRMEDYPMIRK